MDDTCKGSICISNEPVSIIKDNYGIVVLKTLLDNLVLANAMKIMEEKKDDALAAATLNYIFVAAEELCTSVGPYIPHVSQERLVDAMMLAINQLSTSFYMNLIDSGKLAYCLNHVYDCCCKASCNSATKEAITKCKGAFAEVRHYVESEHGKKVGYTVASDDDSVGITLGNALMAKVCKAGVNHTDDLRCSMFANVLDNNVFSTVAELDTIAKKTLDALRDNVSCKSLIEGANYVNETSERQIKSYISEVISACSNAEGLKETFNKTNFDLDCYVTENLTLENYVPDVTTSNFGWMHESIVMGATPRIHAITEAILGLKEGQLKEDMMLDKRDPEFNGDVDGASIDQNKPITITGKNLQYVLGAAALEKDGKNRRLIAERLAEAVINTINWETTNENYSDLPAITYLNRSQRILETLTKNTGYYNNLMETWRIVVSELSNNHAVTEASKNSFKYKIGSKLRKAMGFSQILSDEDVNDLESAIKEALPRLKPMVMDAIEKEHCKHADKVVFYNINGIDINRSSQTGDIITIDSYPIDVYSDEYDGEKYSTKSAYSEFRHLDKVVGKVFKKWVSSIKFPNVQAIKFSDASDADNDTNTYMASYFIMYQKNVNECVTQGVFNLTPTINEITPMPVGTRAVQLAFNELGRAETDEEIDSAMFEFIQAYTMMEGGGMLTLRNIPRLLANLWSNARNTGNWDTVEKNLLKMAKECKNMDEIKYLRKDIPNGRTYLQNQKNIVTKVEKGDTSGLNESQVKYGQKLIKSGVTSEKLDAHLKWIETTYRDAINERAKELKNKEKTPISEGIFSKHPYAKNDADNITQIRYRIKYIQPILPNVKPELAKALKKVGCQNYIKWLRYPVPNDIYSNNNDMLIVDLDTSYMDAPAKNAKTINTVADTIENALNEWITNVPIPGCYISRKSFAQNGDQQIDFYVTFKDMRTMAQAIKDEDIYRTRGIKQILNTPIEYIEESSQAGKTARKVSREVQKKQSKAINKQGGAMREIKAAVKNAVDPMEKYIGQMLQKVKKADADERREILIKGGVLPKVRRWLKRSIGLIAGAAVGTVLPVAATITGITLIGFIATDKMLDAKEKRKLLRELDDEITIVNEKIDDSRSDENKQNKYELMRIRNELQRTRERIILNLKE